jgi:pimeloyl-ACP methyl ester carboxylesterase
MAIYIKESGSATAPTILFIHGGGGGGWVWRPQVEKLTEYHCVMPDLPEQGLSLNEKPFTIKQSAELMAEVIKEHAHNGKAHVVGISEGAQVLVELLSIAPELVDHAIVCGALVRPVFGSWLLRPLIVKLIFLLTIQPIKSSDIWIRRNMKKLTGIPEIYYPEYKQSFINQNSSAFTNVVSENLRYRLPSGLENVKSQTLVIVGKNEHKAMLDSARDIASAIPGAEAYKVTHARNMTAAQEHNWNLTAPRLFNETVGAWLADQSLPNELKLL